MAAVEQGVVAAVCLLLLLCVCCCCSGLPAAAVEAVLCEVMWQCSAAVTVQCVSVLLQY